MNRLNAFPFETEIQRKMNTFHVKEQDNASLFYSKAFYVIWERKH